MKSTCRHCGDPVSGEPGHLRHWIHDSGLIRCQRPGRKYGYEARPASDRPCDCFACCTFGPTSPQDNEA